MRGRYQEERAKIISQNKSEINLFQRYISAHCQLLFQLIFHSQSMRKLVFNILDRIPKRRFSTLVIPDSSVINCDPTRTFKGFQPLFKQDVPQTYKITKLDSGVSILTESSPFPSHTDIGLLGDFGVKNETEATGGSMKMLKNLLHMGGNEEQILRNYELNQFNGGGLEMSFDQESTYYKCSCMTEDIDTMLSLLLKTSLQPKDFSMFDGQILQEEADAVIFEEMFLKAAFDGKGVGKTGVNINIKEKDFLQFQNNFVTPQRVIISAANVTSHEYFVELVKSHLNNYPEFLNRKFTSNPHQSIYVGRDLRIDNQNETTEVGIGFKSIDWMHSDLLVLQVVMIMVGKASYFSTGGPGKGMHSRATKNLLNRLSYVQGADCISNIFSEAGLFGLKLTGSSENVKQLVEACIQELLLLLKPISPIELQRSKNILKSLMHLSLERQQDRLEEASKHILNFKKIRLHEAEQLIDKVTSDDINNLIRRLIKGSRPTITMIGQNVSRAQSFEKIAQAFYLI